MKTAIVIISHYNAWSPKQLISLLDQIHDIPAGYPFSVRIVVNQAEDRLIELPEKYANVNIYYRKNSGYNIGAWDYGWRQSPQADYYLFLQDECVILKTGWLKAFIKSISHPKVGLVGESLILWNSTWSQVDKLRKHKGLGPVIIFGKELSWGDGVNFFLTKHNIKYSKFADHLQALVLCSRYDTLERINGFLCCESKDEAICSEIAISKSVQAIGLSIRQLRFRPFKYIHHPQWDAEREASKHFFWLLKRAANIYIPRVLTQYIREFFH
jgi:hypothetical protein